MGTAHHSDEDTQDEANDQRQQGDDDGDLQAVSDVSPTVFFDKVRNKFLLHFCKPSTQMLIPSCKSDRHNYTRKCTQGKGSIRRFSIFRGFRQRGKCKLFCFSFISGRFDQKKRSEHTVPLPLPSVFPLRRAAIAALSTRFCVYSPSALRHNRNSPSRESTVFRFAHRAVCSSFLLPFPPLFSDRFVG